jgi:hypothetical protein
MERTYTASTRLALALFAALFAFSLYRAATRDVTPSEAWNYDRYIGPSWHDSLEHYDLNNHFLNTLLARISTRKLRLTEFSLRLPSLLSGLFYFWGVWRLSRRIFGGWMFAAAIGVMTLNPLLVDALSEARGYGMALGAWLWALALMYECAERFSSKKLNLAAILLAVSVAACPTFVMAALGLIGAFTWAARRPVVRDLYLPFLVFLFVLLVLPLNRALLSDFKSGSKSLWQMFVDLSHHSFGNLPGIAQVLVAVAAISALIALWRASADALLMLTAGSAVITIVLLQVAHAWIKSFFPAGGAIYFVPMITLTLLGLCGRYSRIGLRVAVAVCVIYAVRFPCGAYLDGGASRGGREIAKALRVDAGKRHVRVAASEELEPVVNYYRSQYGQANWDRVERKQPGPGYDYYVLPDDGAASGMGLRVTHRAGRMVLAKP